MSRINNELAGGDPSEFDKLEMIDELVEYDIMSISLADAIGTVKAVHRERLQELSYETIRATYVDTFGGF